MRKIKNPWLKKEGYNCFGCAPDNPIGLHMDFFEDGEQIISYWRPQEYYQGWVDTLHGGIISTLMDETAGWVVTRKLQTAGVTSSLNVKFLKPVKTTESQITIRALVKERRRNIISIHVTLENSHEEICAEADAVYFAFGEEKAREMGFTECGVESEELLSM
jgi:uncharacterized protein (TIGR00369 family)